MALECRRSATGVHDNIKFKYGTSNPLTTAVDVYNNRIGVCRDFAHLAISFCRAMNIPARYVFGYLPDLYVPPDPNPMDFAAWMEVYLGDRWWTFDPRNNARRVGRVLIGRGRDALDVAMLTTFGPAAFKSMTVWADVAEGGGVIPLPGAPVDWSSARRASYQITQSFRYEYPAPIRDLSHRLVVIPPERFGDQRRLRHRVSAGIDGVRFENRHDRFGNVIVDAFAPRVSSADRVPGRGHRRAQRRTSPTACRPAGSQTPTCSSHPTSPPQTHGSTGRPTSSPNPPSGACRSRTASTTGSTSR